MAGKFVTTGKQAPIAGSFKTLLSLIGAATVAPLINEFTLSTSGVAADGVLEWAVMRQTADGTATGVTPISKSYSPGIVTPIAAICTSKENYTVEGTVTAGSELFDQGINQRAAYRWYAGPGDEIIIPAVAAAAVVIRALSTVAPAYSGQADATMAFAE